MKGGGRGVVASELKDMPRATRKGEELDSARLGAYISARLPGCDGEVQIEQFPSGFSNLTYCIHIGSKEFVLRRPPIGAQVSTAHDVCREYRILSGLHPLFGRVPRPILLCDDESIIGAPFYLMERVMGVILRNRATAGVELSERLMGSISRSFVANLVQIHGLDPVKAGLGGLGHPEGYVKRQIEGWTKRYFNARTDDVPVIEETARWLASRIPSESGATLIHNDYKYDNIALSPSDMSSVVAVLDWEMATIGDPLMDLGTTLGYWVESGDRDEWQASGLGLTMLPGNLRRMEIVELYERLSGREVVEPVYYYVYGLFKIAVIVQQIYFRYRMGKTRDPRFSNLIAVVRAAGSMATRAIEKGRIDDLG